MSDTSPFVSLHLYSHLKQMISALQSDSTLNEPNHVSFPNQIVSLIPPKARLHNTNITHGYEISDIHMQLQRCPYNPDSFNEHEVHTVKVRNEYFYPKLGKAVAQFEEKNSLEKFKGLKNKFNTFLYVFYSVKFQFLLNPKNHQLLSSILRRALDNFENFSLDPEHRRRFLVKKASQSSSQTFTIPILASQTLYDNLFVSNPGHSDCERLLKILDFDKKLTSVWKPKTAIDYLDQAHLFIKEAFHPKSPSNTALKFLQKANICLNIAKKVELLKQHCSFFQSCLSPFIPDSESPTDLLFNPPSLRISERIIASCTDTCYCFHAIQNQFTEEIFHGIRLGVFRKCPRCSFLHTLYIGRNKLFSKYPFLSLYGALLCALKGWPVREQLDQFRTQYISLNLQEIPNWKQSISFQILEFPIPAELNFGLVPETPPPIIPEQIPKSLIPTFKSVTNALSQANLAQQWILYSKHFYNFTHIPYFYLLEPVNYSNIPVNLQPSFVIRYLQNKTNIELWKSYCSEPGVNDFRFFFFTGILYFNQKQWVDAEKLFSKALVLVKTRNLHESLRLHLIQFILQCLFKIHKNDEFESKDMIQKLKEIRKIKNLSFIDPILCFSYSVYLKNARKVSDFSWFFQFGQYLKQHLDIQYTSPDEKQCISFSSENELTFPFVHKCIKCQNFLFEKYFPCPRCLCIFFCSEDCLKSSHHITNAKCSEHKSPQFLGSHLVDKLQIARDSIRTKLEANHTPQQLYKYIKQNSKKMFSPDWDSLHLDTLNLCKLVGEYFPTHTPLAQKMKKYRNASSHAQSNYSFSLNNVQQLAQEMQALVSDFPILKDPLQSFLTRINILVAYQHIHHSIPPVTPMVSSQDIIYPMSDPYLEVNLEHDGLRSLDELIPNLLDQLKTNQKTSICTSLDDIKKDLPHHIYMIVLLCLYSSQKDLVWERLVDEYSSLQNPPAQIYFNNPEISTNSWNEQVIDSNRAHDDPTMTYVNNLFRMAFIKKHKSEFGQVSTIQILPIVAKAQIFREKSHRARQRGDYPECIKFCHEGAKLGCSDACYHLSKFYSEAMDMDKAIKYAKEGSESHFLFGEAKVYCETQLGHFYYLSDPSKSQKWFYKAARHGSITAWNDLGSLHLDQGNSQKAIECYKKAAERGYATAMFNLSILFKKKNDYSSYFHWRKKACSLWTDTVESLCFELEVLFPSEIELKNQEKINLGISFVSTFPLECHQKYFALGILFFHKTDSRHIGVDHILHSFVLGSSRGYKFLTTGLLKHLTGGKEIAGHVLTKEFDFPFHLDKLIPMYLLGSEFIKFILGPRKADTEILDNLCDWSQSFFGIDFGKKHPVTITQLVIPDMSPTDILEKYYFETKKIIFGLLPMLYPTPMKFIDTWFEAINRMDYGFFRNGLFPYMNHLYNLVIKNDPRILLIFFDMVASIQPIPEQISIFQNLPVVCREYPFYHSRLGSLFAFNENHQDSIDHFQKAIQGYKKSTSEYIPFGNDSNSYFFRFDLYYLKFVSHLFSNQDIEKSQQLLEFYLSNSPPNARKRRRGCALMSKYLILNGYPELKCREWHRKALAQKPSLIFIKDDCKVLDSLEILLHLTFDKQLPTTTPLPLTSTSSLSSPTPLPLASTSSISSPTPLTLASTSSLSSPTPLPLASTSSLSSPTTSSLCPNRCIICKADNPTVSCLSCDQILFCSESCKTRDVSRSQGHKCCRINVLSSNRSILKQKFADAAKLFEDPFRKKLLTRKNRFDILKKALKKSEDAKSLLKNNSGKKSRSDQDVWDFSKGKFTFGVIFHLFSQMQPTPNPQKYPWKKIKKIKDNIYHGNPVSDTDVQLILDLFSNISNVVQL